MLKFFSMLSSWRTALSTLVLSAHGHHGGSKRSAAIGSILLVMAMFVACGDDGSDSATRPSGGSSSNLVSLATPCKTETEDNCEYGELVDGRDGQVYKTVSIGTQIWMAQNLNYETANSYCYNDNASNCIKYGRLYTWAAAMDSAGTWSANGEGCGDGKTCLERNPVRGVCPEGWHLPSKDEWETLFTAVDGKSTAGTKLKSTSGWNRNGNGTDDFSFSALPAGYGDFYGIGHCEGEDAYFLGQSLTLSKSLRIDNLSIEQGRLGRPFRVLEDRFRMLFERSMYGIF